MRSDRSDERRGAGVQFTPRRSRLLHNFARSGVSDALDALASMGCWIGLATNDAEMSARQQLTGLGWLHRFESVIGYDSGFGAKPGSGMLLESAGRAGVKPKELVFVGDTDTDLRTAAAAGCPSVLVHAPVSSIQPTVHLVSLAELPALLA